MDSLYFKTKQDLSVDKTHLIEILFKDWVDTVCNREVEFSIERRISEEWLPGMVTKKETFRVDFQRAEDITMIKLIGLPNEFLNLIEFAAN
jgi:hypothetical protein